MFPIIFGVSILKNIAPYIRQHIFTHLEHWEFIFINSIIVGFISGFYAYVIKKENIMNLSRLEWSQYIAIFFLSSITIFSSLTILQLEQVSVLQTTFILKAFSMLILVFFGIFLFEEKITMKDILGFLLIFLGCFLIKFKNYSG